MRSSVMVELRTWLTAAQTGTSHVLYFSPHPFLCYTLLAKFWHSSDPALSQLNSPNYQGINLLKKKKKVFQK